jgi:hypothetical protein
MTQKAIFLTEFNFLELFLNCFSSGSSILMVIYDLFKYNCQMLYCEENMAEPILPVGVLRSRYLEHRTVDELP